MPREREYIYDIEHVEKYFDSKTNTAVFGFKAKQWNLKITRISTGSYGYDIVVDRKVVGHVMCGTNRPYPPYIPDEFIIELFPTGADEEIKHPNPDGIGHTSTPYRFRKTVTSMYEVTRLIDEQINPLHWWNEPHLVENPNRTAYYTGEEEPARGIIHNRTWSAK